MKNSKLIYFWVPSSSKYNSLFLQANLLAENISRKMQVKIKILHPETQNIHKLLKEIVNSRKHLIWHYGGFDPHLISICHRDNIVFIYHNITPAKYFWAYQPQVGLRSYMGRFQLSLLPKSSRWVAVSEYNANELNRYGFSNVQYCPNIVLIDRNEKNRNEKVHKTGHFSLLYVGRISPNKNCLALLDQVAKAANYLSSRVELTIVGNVKNKCRFGKTFEKMVNVVSSTHQYLEINWIKNGVDFNQLKDLYTRSWLYISMSLHEGFGLPVCEAIAYGTPALYMECGGTESLLQGNGMITVKQSNNFGKKIVSMLTSKLARDTLVSKQISCVKQFLSPEVDSSIQKVFSFLQNNS